MEAGAGSDDPTMTEHGIYVPGRPFAIFIQVSNRGRFCQYISLPMKYTVSGSTLQYKVGLTLSFLSLISRGVGGIQKGNTSIGCGDAPLYSTPATGTECHGILRYGKIYEYSLFCFLFYLFKTSPPEILST